MSEYSDVETVLYFMCTKKCCKVIRTLVITVVTVSLLDTYTRVRARAHTHAHTTVDVPAYNCN